MRVRTGHKPNDWTDNELGGFARLSGHGGTSIHGELVQGGESDTDRQRRHQRENRWDGRERCGKMMKQAKQPCARTAGHRRECKSAEAMEYSRTIRTRVA